MTHPATTTPRADRRGMQIPGAGPVARLLLAGGLSLVVVIVAGVQLGAVDLTILKELLLKEMLVDIVHLKEMLVVHTTTVEAAEL